MMRCENKTTRMMVQKSNMNVSSNKEEHLRNVTVLDLKLIVTIYSDMIY